MQIATTQGVTEISLTAPGSVRLNRHAATGRIPLWLARQQPGAAELAASYLEGAVRLRDTIDALEQMCAGKNEYGVVMAEMVLANRLGAGGAQWVALAKEWCFQGAKNDDLGRRYPEWVEAAIETSGWDAVCRQPWQSISGGADLFQIDEHNPASIADLTVKPDAVVLGIGETGVETRERWLAADDDGKARIESERFGAALLDS